MPVRLVRLVLKCPMDCGARGQIPVRAVMGDAVGWEDMKAVAWHRATPPHGVVLYGVKV